MGYPLLEDTETDTQSVSDSPGIYDHRKKFREITPLASDMAAFFLSLFPLLPQLFAPILAANQEDSPRKHFFNPKSHECCCQQVLLTRRCPMLHGQRFPPSRGRERAISDGSWPWVEEVGAPKQSPASLGTAVAGCAAFAARQRQKPGGLQVRQSRKLHSSQGQLVMLGERDILGTTLSTGICLAARLPAPHH